VLLLQAALIAALLVERRLRRQTASALAESEQRMKVAAGAARLSMWIWDIARDRLWTDAPPELSAGASGTVPTQLHQLLETVHPEDRADLERAVRQAAANEGELDVEYRMLGPGGDVRWVAARGRAEKGDGGLLTGVALDITERKTAEHQAAKDRAALTHMTRVSMMGQLTASIAHQLNQPLAAILGNAEAARKMLGRGNVDVAELTDICNDIVAEDQRTVEIIRNLSALFKRGELKFAPLDVNELVLETLDLARTELASRRVVAVTELAASLPAVDGGRIHLQQVLLNLVLNAADAMSGPRAAGRRLTVRTGLEDGNALLCVADQGTGIAPEDIKSVFDAFWTTKSGGTGVGLAICRSIIAAHGGQLTVANNPEGGATFCAVWPAAQRS